MVDRADRGRGVRAATPPDAAQAACGDKPQHGEAPGAPLAIAPPLHPPHQRCQSRADRGTQPALASNGVG
ncbi:hypothetical protein, partial [Candidatus Entotheonella palauensis]|uniref:hypothetical protein n=1 Tax=Candidatus Entotheonella palauensis TaxID=93172 RepID=UPI001C4E2671